MTPDCLLSESGPSRRLYVYECRGVCLPKQEPAHPSFLGIWSEPPSYYYLFFSEPAAIYVKEWIRDQVGWSLDGHYDLDYDQWQQVPRAEQRVGPFVITINDHQPLSPAALHAHELPISLDPGVVFGSGLHPTSRGALLAISHRIASRCVKTAVDFGTGTGILAAACAKCGAERVFAIDCNPLAVRAALRNAARNGLDDRVFGIAAITLGVIRAPTDLLVMNIEWPSLQQVFQEGAWTSHCAVVVSGFLKHCEEEVRDRLTAAGTFHVTWRHEEDGWPTLIASREPSRYRGS